eukprot:evm.model.scf_3.16 EVM.evm.TU.scf_3.16   scf_3:293873-295297(+)
MGDDNEDFRKVVEPSMTKMCESLAAKAKELESSQEEHDFGAVCREVYECSEDLQATCEEAGWGGSEDSERGDGRDDGQDSNADNGKRLRRILSLSALRRKALAEDSGEIDLDATLEDMYMTAMRCGLCRMCESPEGEYQPFKWFMERFYGMKSEEVVKTCLADFLSKDEGGCESVCDVTPPGGCCPEEHCRCGKAFDDGDHCYEVDDEDDCRRRGCTWHKSGMSDEEMESMQAHIRNAYDEFEKESCPLVATALKKHPEYLDEGGGEEGELCYSSVCQGLVASAEELAKGTLDKVCDFDDEEDHDFDSGATGDLFLRRLKCDVCRGCLMSPDENRENFEDVAGKDKAVILERCQKLFREGKENH